MAQQFWIHDCACDMMQVKELPLDLRNYLDDIEMYANFMKGSIQSRQVVAMALVNYLDRKAFLNAIDDLKEFVNYEE